MNSEYSQETAECISRIEPGLGTSKDAPNHQAQQARSLDRMEFLIAAITKVVKLC